jgi:hypothetical protein
MSSIVVVSCSNGPNDFWILKENFLIHESEFSKVVDEIGKDDSQKVSAGSVKTGQIYLAKPIGTDQSDTYHRIKTIEILERDAWRVLFLDYGITMKINVKYFRALTEFQYLRDMQPKAIRCRLQGAENMNTNKIKDLFNFMVAKRLVLISIYFLRMLHNFIHLQTPIHHENY